MRLFACWEISRGSHVIRSSYLISVSAINMSNQLWKFCNFERCCEQPLLTMGVEENKAFINCFRKILLIFSVAKVNYIVISNFPMTYVVISRDFIAFYFSTDFSDSYNKCFCDFEDSENAFVTSWILSWKYTVFCAWIFEML